MSLLEDLGENNPNITDQEPRSGCMGSVGDIYSVYIHQGIGWVKTFSDLTLVRVIPFGVTVSAEDVLKYFYNGDLEYMIVDGRAEEFLHSGFKVDRFVFKRPNGLHLIIPDAERYRIEVQESSKEETPRCDRCQVCYHDKARNRDGMTYYCSITGRDVGQSHFGHNSPRCCPRRRINSL